MKKIFGVLLVFIVCLAAFPREDGHSPLYSYISTYGAEREVTLHGKTFYSSQELCDSFKEQDGYAMVNDRKLHYWLYDTYSEHKGDGDFIINKVIPKWVERLGYVIDFDNIEIYKPNTNLANSVKMLMRQRGCDISATLVTKENDNVSYDYVIINNYDAAKKEYYSILYPLYK